MLYAWRRQGAETKGSRLFNKNTTSCEAERLCIRGDVCPVRVSEYPFQGVKGLVNGGSNYNFLKVAIIDCLNAEQDLPNDTMRAMAALGKSGHMLEYLKLENSFFRA